MDRRKSRKGFTSIIYETYKDFAENTSIHGLKYTVQHGIPLYEKIFWIFIILIGLLGAAYMTILFWSRYISNPTRTSIATAFAPNTAVPFPAITLCNLNQIHDAKIQEFANSIVSEDKEDYIFIRNTLSQLLVLASQDQMAYNITELKKLERYLLENNYDIYDVLKKISQPCNEMIVKCLWELKVVPCAAIFQDTLTTDGHCCSFNYIRQYKESTRDPIHTPYNGFTSGLRLLINPSVTEQGQQHSTLNTQGLKVIIHTSWDFPGSGSSYKIISVGRQSYLEITASKIISSEEMKQLSISERGCVYSDEFRLRYFQLYSDTNCLSECEEDYLYAQCGCVPFYYPFSKQRVCNISSLACLDRTKSWLIQNGSHNCDHCPSQCEDLFYDVFLSTATLGSKDAAPTSDFINYDNITAHHIELNVYFTGNRQIILHKDTVTSTLYLLSSFGGIYSLFLGCSFISIIEILYYSTFRLMCNLKQVGRIEKSNEEITKRNKDKLWIYDNAILYLD